MSPKRRDPFEEACEAIEAALREHKRALERTDARVSRRLAEKEGEARGAER